MSRLASLLLGTILFCVAAVPIWAQKSPEGTADDTKEIVKIEKDLLNTYITGDMAVRERYVADDFAGVDLNGETFTKQSDIQDVKTGEFVVKSFNMTNEKVSFLNPDVALLTYEIAYEATENGENRSTHSRVGVVYVRRNGAWRYLYSQETAAKSLQAAEETEVENHIVALEKRLWMSGATDVSELEADDYESIKHAHRYHRADDEAAAKDAKFDLVSMDDIHVRMLRPDVALLTYHATQKGSFRGINVPPSLYFGSIWVKQGADWKNVFLEENLPDAFTETYSQDTNVANTAIPEANATEFPPDSFFIAKEKEDWEAIKNRDKAAATRLLADDFVGMYDFGFFNKSEWVKQLDDHYTVDDYTIENAKVLHPSATTALLLYTSNCKGTGAWADFCSHTSRISDLFVERNGQWLGLFSQDTQATTSQPLSHDDLTGNSRVDLPTGKDTSQTVPGPSAATTVVHLDANTKFTPFEEMIIGKEKEAIEAVEKNNLKDFASLIADDFLFIADDGFWGKREYLKSFEEDVAWEDCKMEDVRVSSSGENSAIISYKQTWTGRDHGKRFEIVIYTHGHWEKRKGQWVVTLWQDTPAENGSTPADETEPLLTLPTSHSRSNLQTEVLSREHSFMEALKRNDCPTVSGFMADGLVAIGVNGIQGKAAYAKLCETRQKQWTEFELEQVQVYPLRANSAVLVKKVVLSGTDQGKQFRSVELWHEDWERLNGVWKITGLQDTRAK